MSSYAAILILLPTIASSAVSFQPISTNLRVTEVPSSSRTIMRNTNGNYTVSYVPLFSLLAGIIPRIMSRVRMPTTPRGIAKRGEPVIKEVPVPTPSLLPESTFKSEDEEDSEEEDESEDRSIEVAEIDSKSSEEPIELNETNLCTNFMVERGPYRNNPCFFYQCELFEPVTSICSSQILQDQSLVMSIDYTKVEKKSFLMRVSDCLAIRVYKCSPGFLYNRYQKQCVRQDSSNKNEDSCIMT